MEVKIVSRGAGRSAVAAAAYMSCSCITNDYDGITHDYTRKQGLVFEKVLLPASAPAEWSDRSVLWNAVEAAEKTRDNRLARELVIALPVELSREKQIELAETYARRYFVSDGMCADVCIHDIDGHNPHAHILLTIRPLTKNGNWQAKTQKEYLCVLGGEERGFTSAEFLQAKKEGWEKQFLYRVGEKSVYLPPSKAYGLERVNKYPKATRYGRQNPISARWNSEEQLLLWRECWANLANDYLTGADLSERIDHRSYRALGYDLQPTIHEGIVAVVMARRGLSADRRSLNRQIKRDNQLLHDLKETLKYLAKTMVLLIPRIADALEELRVGMLASDYRKRTVIAESEELRRERNRKENVFAGLNAVKEKIVTKESEIAGWTTARKKTPVFFREKRKEIDATLQGLNEEWEELKSERERIVATYLDGKTDLTAEDMEKLRTDTEARLSQLDKEEKRCDETFEQSLSEYRKVESEAAEADADKLAEARNAIREEKESELQKRIETSCGQVQERRLYESRVKIAGLIGEEPPEHPKELTFEEYCAMREAERAEEKARKDREWREMRQRQKEKQRKETNRGGHEK